MVTSGNGGSGDNGSSAPSADIPEAIAERLETVTIQCQNLMMLLREIRHLETTHRNRWKWWSKFNWIHRILLSDRPMKGEKYV